jgi:hypothetical protein
MKKTSICLSVLTLFLLLTTQAKAQYAKGDISLNAGISFGVIGYGGYYGSSFRGFFPVTANVEYSIDENFAVGGFVGYYGRSYKSYNNNRDYRNRFSATSLGGRFTFHATNILNEVLDSDIDESKWDLYATAIAGLAVRRWNYGYNYNGLEPYDNEIRLILGPVLGVRYFAKPNLGVYFEGGRGVYGIATLGITGKF